MQKKGLLRYISAMLVLAVTTIVAVSASVSAKYTNTVEIPFTVNARYIEYMLQDGKTFNTNIKKIISAYSIKKVKFCDRSEVDDKTTYVTSYNLACQQDTDNQIKSKGINVYYDQTAGANRTAYICPGEPNKRLWANPSIINLFNGCTTLTSIEFNNFHTDITTVFSSMCFNCTSLRTVDMSGFNTSKAKYMVGMFNKCTSLTSIDISSFSTENNPSTAQMFWNISITKITVGDKWAFNGTEWLDTPSSGYWYASDGTAYSSYTQLPKYKADTYTSTKPN